MIKHLLNKQINDIYFLIYSVANYTWTFSSWHFWMKGGFRNHGNVKRQLGILSIITVSWFTTNPLIGSVVSSLSFFSFNFFHIAISLYIKIKFVFCFCFIIKNNYYKNSAIKTHAHICCFIKILWIENFICELRQRKSVLELYLLKQ